MALSRPVEGGTTMAREPAPKPMPKTCGPLAGTPAGKHGTPPMKYNGKPLKGC